MRNLTNTLAIVSLLVPASAYPLGIGEIKLHSSLNQNLDAEIALVLAPGEKPSDIKVSLAPPDKFDQSGVPWTYFLSKLKFQTIESNGAIVIKVTSREALKEPFLDFLLEVNWPKGSLYREFTVLVDPPAVYEQPSLPAVAESGQNNDEGYGARRELPVRIPPVPRHQVKHPRNAISAGQYGPTVRSDTLWRVAEHISAENGASVEQTMMALYDANPHAFYKQNVNALLAGKTLKVPDREAVLKLSRQQAIIEFDRQNQAWKNHSAGPMPLVAAETPPVDKQLTLVAPKQDTIDQNAAVGVEPETQAADKKPMETTADKPAISVSGVLGQAEATKKTSETGAGSVANAADDTLNSKIAALEKQLAMMQELVALKDQQLANLQGQSQKPPVAKPQAPQPPVTPAQPEPVQALPQEPVPPKPAIKPKPATVVGPETETGLEWPYLLGGGLGLGILGYGGWLLWRRRNPSAAGAGDFAFDIGGSVSKPSATSKDSFFEDSNVQSADAAAPPFGGEFSASEFDMFEMDQGEIDPVSEADVYLAYGRYQQAEELMRHSINDTPDRDDYKLKLLEIYYSSENKAAFEHYADELFDAGKNSDTVFWSKVTEMGSEICPDSVLFSANQQHNFVAKKEPVTEQRKPPVSEQANLGGQLLDEMDFDLSSFEELFGGDPLGKSSANELGLSKPPQEIIIDPIRQELDISDDEPKPNNESIDFDFSGFSTDIGKPDNGLKQPMPSGGKADEEDGAVVSLDFDAAIEHSDEQFFDVGKFGMADLAQMDEMETKLDLAIAYVDMGDAGAAREIAAEVLKNGNKEQQMIAKSLLDNLAE